MAEVDANDGIRHITFLLKVGAFKSGVAAAADFDCVEILSQSIKAFFFALELVLLREPEDRVGIRHVA